MQKPVNGSLQKATLIAGPGEMAALIQAHDWSSTPFGRIEDWPESLIATANLALRSPFPTIIAWGAEFAILYNDAAIPTMSARHPGALGSCFRDIFPETWDQMRGDLEACLHKGAAPVRDDILIPVIRNGSLEDHYWSYSMIPVYADGVVAGIYNAFRNVTEGVLANRRLLESEARLKLATKVAKLGIFMWDTSRDDGIWENERMYEIFGRTREQGVVNGKVFLNEVVHPSDRDLFRAAVEATLQRGEAFHFEGCIVRPDAAIRCIEVNGEMQQQSEDSKKVILGTIRDVTEMRKTDEALRKSARHLGELAAIVDSSDDVILSKDLNGIVTSWNTAAQRVFGYSAEEMIGSSIVKLIPEHLHSDERAILDKIREGQRIEHFETQRVTRSGQLLDVSLTISPVRDQEGNVIGASKILRDIAPRKHTEQLQHELSSRMAELAAIVESSDDVIVSKDLNGIITSWNASATRVFGYTADEMIGQSILKLIPEDLHSDEKLIIENIRAGRRVEHFETIRRTKDGSLIEVSLTVSPIKNANGTVVGASKILRDVSDRKRMELSLMQAEKIAATGRMAATIAHEINNPLDAIMNLLYLMRPKVTDEEGANFLGMAEAELNRVAHIAKQTLGYYREHASATHAALSEIADQAVAIYEPRCVAAGIALRKQFESATKVMLRRGEMMQVISNLIANSIYAMPAGGTLSISVVDTTHPVPGVVLRVADTGEGIAAETLPKVFDAFFTTRTTVGTGIGLFVAKQFVEGHGGRISIESSMDEQSHGTAVQVFLPQHTCYESESE